MLDPFTVPVAFGLLFVALLSFVLGTLISLVAQARNAEERRRLSRPGARPRARPGSTTSPSHWG